MAAPKPDEIQLRIVDSAGQVPPDVKGAANGEEVTTKVGDMLGGSSVESIDDHCQNFPTSTWTQFRILFIR